MCREDEVGVGDRLRRCGRRPGPAGPASPIAGVSDRRDGGLPAAPTQSGALLGARPFLVSLRGAAVDTPVPRAAFGSRKRPRHSRICDTPARDFRPLP